MANQEQLDILKQGVKVWNEWRKENLGVHIDLSEADLPRANLNVANLSGANLSNADLGDSSLRQANLRHANLREADLRAIDFMEADLYKATLINANLRHSHLDTANLTEADLKGADLSGTYLYRTILRDADFNYAACWETFFSNVDLQNIKGLENVDHHGPSSIDIRTIYRSQGKIPEAFLKRAGVDDTFITYVRSLVGKAIEYYSCFISYSSKDKAFAKRLYADLQSHNVRCWFAPEDLKWGERIRTGIDEAIHLHDKLLLIPSKSSVASGWVEREVKAALAKERIEKRTVLFPVRVDNAVFESPFDWGTEIRRERNIGDFTQWKAHDDYERAFSRLLGDLKAET